MTTQLTETLYENRPLMECTKINKNSWTPAVPPSDLPVDLKAHLYKGDFDEIPVIDLNTPRNELLDMVKRAAENIGFMTIKNHSIPVTTREEMMRVTKEFFDLPIHIKEKYAISPPKRMAGYCKKGIENVDGVFFKSESYLKRRKDTKENLDLVHCRRHPENKTLDCERWLDANQLYPNEEVTDFERILVEYQTQILNLALILLDLVNDAILPQMPGIFRSSCTDKYVNVHRLLHYPNLDNYTQNVSIGAHIDYGLMTILATDEVGGLQVLNAAQNKWIHVPPMYNGYVVNFGAMFSRWTNHRVKAAIHRVVNLHNQERYSSPYFVRPSLSTILDPCVLGFITDEQQEVTTCQQVLDEFYGKSLK